MNAFSKIDMAEATRLTRAGKLAEAMAVLQGRALPGDPEPRTAAATRRLALGSSALRSAPSSQSKSSSERPTPPTAGDSEDPGVREALPGLAYRMRALRERLPKMHAFGRLGEGAGSVSIHVPEGARFEERTFSNGAGARNYKVYVPSGYNGQPLPVVVMLHGCTQNPDDFAAGTRMNEVAEAQTFLVVYPHQPQSANMKKCWNWFDAAEQRRDGGEPSLIAGIALRTIEEFSADPARVYVAGLSAGGAAAAILATTHPDLFAAAGVHSGLACGAARDMPSAFAAMAGTTNIPPHAETPAAPTIVFHGDADRTVHVVNADHVAAQAGRATMLSEIVTRGETPGGVTYTRKIGLDASGKEILEQWVVHGMGHAWSGGSASGSYSDPRGPDASREMIRFFLKHVNGRASGRA